MRCAALALGLLLVAQPAEVFAQSPSTSRQPGLPPAAPLSLNQVQQLLSIGTPDNAIAQELERRGAAFSLDDQTLNDLQRLGAGPKTQEVLKSLRPKGTLVVSAHQPDAEVFVDKIRVGVTDAQGQLRVPLLVGTHEVTVTKGGYEQTGPFKENVEHNKELPVDITLERSPVRVGGSIRPPSKIKDVRPEYTGGAKSAGVRGVIIVEFIIETDGSVASVKVLRSIPQLDQAAINAVKQWKFTTTQLNGEPVRVSMTATLNFP